MRDSTQFIITVFCHKTNLSQINAFPVIKFNNVIIFQDFTDVLNSRDVICLGAPVFLK